MKYGLVFTAAILLLAFVISCTKENAVQTKENVVQTFDYCDFNDVVLRYPDTTGIGKDTFYLHDSVLLNIECNSNTYLTVFGIISHLNGKPNPPYTNKGMATGSSSTYFIQYTTALNCFDPHSKNDEIKDMPYVPNSMVQYGWTSGVRLVSDSWFGCFNIDLGDIYIPIRKHINSELFYGWVHCNFTADSAVFYDCAFSHQKDLSIKAGQH